MTTDEDMVMPGEVKKKRKKREGVLWGGTILYMGISRASM